MFWFVLFRSQKGERGYGPVYSYYLGSSINAYVGVSTKTGAFKFSPFHYWFDRDLSELTPSGINYFHDNFILLNSRSKPQSMPNDNDSDSDSSIVFKSLQIEFEQEVDTAGTVEPASTSFEQEVDTAGTVEPASTSTSASAAPVEPALVEPAPVEPAPVEPALVEPASTRTSAGAPQKRMVDKESSSASQKKQRVLADVSNQPVSVRSQRMVAVASAAKNKSM